jgi:hypothetical protein
MGVEPVRKLREGAGLRKTELRVKMTERLIAVRAGKGKENGGLNGVKRLLSHAPIPGILPA